MKSWSQYNISEPLPQGFQRQIIIILPFWEQKKTKRGTWKQKHILRAGHHKIKEIPKGNAGTQEKILFRQGNMAPQEGLHYFFPLYYSIFPFLLEEE